MFQSSYESVPGQLLKNSGAVTKVFRSSKCSGAVNKYSGAVNKFSGTLISLP